MDACLARRPQNDRHVPHRATDAAACIVRAPQPVIRKDTARGLGRPEADATIATRHRVPLLQIDQNHLFLLLNFQHVAVFKKGDAATAQPPDVTGGRPPEY